MAWKYLCQGCVRLLEGERESVCLECNHELQRLLNLYNRIVSDRPKHRNKSPAEVFQLLYDSFVRKESGDEPNKR